MTPHELRKALDVVIENTEQPHVERLSISAAIVSEALRLDGVEATLVGGAAIEFYSPGAHVTSDIDLVVEHQRPVPSLERALARTFGLLGFERSGRHWTRDDVFVEVPGIRVTNPTVLFAIGPFRLRVLRKEILLGERIVGFKHWRYTAYGAQALDMMAAFGNDIDSDVLNAYLERENAVDAYHVLRDLAASATSIDAQVLQAELDRLHELRT